jgi:transposase
MAIVKLSNHDRVTLEIIATQTEHSRELRRAQALLWLDEGEGVDEVATRLGASRRTVYYWVERFAASSGRALSQRLADAPRSGRPVTADGIIDESIDEIIETDPRLLGYRATVWTAPLLRQYLADSYTIDVSPRSVSYALARLGLAWKRPRYDLIRCSPTWRQAKGGSNAGSRSAPARSF